MIRKMKKIKQKAYGWKICLINIIKKVDFIGDYKEKINHKNSVKVE